MVTLRYNSNICRQAQCWHTKETREERGLYAVQVAASHVASVKVCLLFACHCVELSAERVFVTALPSAIRKVNSIRAANSNNPTGAERVKTPPFPFEMEILLHTLR